MVSAYLGVDETEKGSRIVSNDAVVGDMILPYSL